MEDCYMAHLQDMRITQYKKIIFNPVDRWDIEYVSSWKCQCLTNYNFDAYVDNNCALLDAIRANGFKGELRNV